ncbi:hypothetical protein LRQ08_11930 [Rhodococcus qingshengii]|uniref:hypothetical protein n=1 Tax=Rhodococcus qingshengii TaxID=334542 RepID=UPI0021110CD0|nr:hypothetical protein [Rhodococcus qingshengii]UUE27510.1 hypothetical protein LRQ08_11930 [Rhodococcus qingshengii]
MAGKPTSVYSRRSRSIAGTLGRTARYHPEADTTDLRRDLAASRIEDHIAAQLAKAPPLTAEQRERITGLLRAGGAKG